MVTSDSYFLAVKSSPSKRRCNSIPALKSSSQEILSANTQESLEEREKNKKLTEGLSFTSLDEEGKKHWVSPYREDAKF